MFAQFLANENACMHPCLRACVSVRPIWKKLTTSKDRLHTWEKIRKVFPLVRLAARITVHLDECVCVRCAYLGWWRMRVLDLFVLLGNHRGDFVVY